MVSSRRAGDCKAWLTNFPHIVQGDTFSSGGVYMAKPVRTGFFQHKMQNTLLGSVPSHTPPSKMGVDPSQVCLAFFVRIPAKSGDKLRPNGGRGGRWERGPHGGGPPARFDCLALPSLLQASAADPRGWRKHRGLAIGKVARRDGLRLKSGRTWCWKAFEVTRVERMFQER